MDDKKFLSFLTDDWKQIPLNYRFIIISGSFLIFNSWLLDNWGATNIYLFWGFDIRKTGYNIGLTLILLSLLPLISKQFIYLAKRQYYRSKYPTNKLDEKFHLVWFRGKLMLFDIKKKKYYHVFPWETALSLSFDKKGVSIDQDFYSQLHEKIRISEEQLIDVEKYSEGGSINTQN